MNATGARDKFNTAMLLLDQAKEEAATLPPLATISSTADLVQRARIVRSVLNARNLFEQVHQRAEGLSEALVRFQQRKDKIASRERGEGFPR
jgi:hypothetical protein